jgi:hypothetical protein
MSSGYSQTPPAGVGSFPSAAEPAVNQSPFTTMAYNVKAPRAEGKFARDAEDERRLRVYDEAKKLLDVDKHKELFEAEFGGRRQQGKYWIPVDLAGMIARLVRDYTFGKGFKIEGIQAPEAVLHLMEVNRLIPLLRQSAKMLPAYGDAVFKIAIEDIEDPLTGIVEPRARVLYVPPWHYFPELDPIDQEKVLGVTLAYCTAKPPGVAAAQPWLVLKEIHVPGSYHYELWEWDGTVETMDRTADLLSVLYPNLDAGVIQTGTKEIPIVHVGYDRDPGEHWGNSEFARIKRLVLSFENRLAQEDEVLEKHARPKLIVGPGALDPKSKINLADFDVIEVDPNVLEKAIKPEYLTWDMQVEGIKHLVEMLEKLLYQTTETSPSSFGLERGGGSVESARALRFKTHRTVNKVEMVRDEYTPVIQAIVRIAIAMENAKRSEDGFGGMERTLVRITWPDPIIEDEAQEIQDYATLKQAKLCSTKRAVKDIFDLTDEEADEEVKAIEEDEKTANELMAPPMLPGENPFGSQPKDGAEGEDADPDPKEKAGEGKPKPKPKGKPFGRS